MWWRDCGGRGSRAGGCRLGRGGGRSGAKRGGATQQGGSEATQIAGAQHNSGGYPVEGRPDSDLMRELRGYLESFLNYPFPPETDHAGRVQAALRRWGEACFTALFGARGANRLFEAATADEYAALTLQVASDDAGVLSWPWEALRDPDLGRLAQTCQIERRVNQLRDPPPLSPQLPKDRVNILLVISRPYEADVRFRSIARPVVDLIHRDLKMPARVDVLRPPTFANLRRHLSEQPHHYHLLHFDGHGSYRGEASAPSGGYQFQA